MGLFAKRDARDTNTHRAQFRRKLARLSQREITVLLEGHVGQLSIAVLGMVQGKTEHYDNNLWEAQRLTDEISVMLEECDGLA